MAGWTKEQYDDAYRIHVERHIGGYTSDRLSQVVVNYHKWAIKPLWERRWALLAPILGLDASMHICVIGAGFGWGVESLIAVTGANCVGVDISDYIAAEINNTELDELRANITAAGLDPDGPRGTEILGHIYDGQPRSNVVVLHQSASTANERQEIRTALGGNWPSHVIFEDLVDDTMTDTEIIQARNAGNGFGGSQTLIWVYTPTVTRSAQDLATLTGNTVIQPDGIVANP